MIHTANFGGRMQQTIGRPVRVSGFGLFHGADVTMEFLPAEAGHGIVFERIDRPGRPRIPALIDYVVPQPRCTVIACRGESVAVIEHVMAALAGLHVDNCLIRIDAPEPPIVDGSCRPFVDALLEAGIQPQNRPRERAVIAETILVTEGDDVGLAAQPSRHADFEIGFVLDYGPGPIPFQSLNLPITRDIFIEHLSPCRTFALEEEVRALREQGLAQRATPQNALVFGPGGVLENELRVSDECVRHKILDCIGDFALLGCDLVGRFTAMRSGHRLNHELVRRIQDARNPGLYRCA
jgi:UDP-3-O-[3-hydroxymyristoyl] N-acetylglucosamine deacetylase